MTVLSLPTRAPAGVATRRRVLVRPATEVTHMTRFRGGTYSHTVDTIVFTDGSTARTDLIRVNPNLRAYSLDFTGIAPQHPSRYRLGSWSTQPHLRARGSEAQVDWILRNSFPLRSTAELSQHLRQAGYPMGSANISEHEAIAATQAAIWHFTNGLALDTRPLNVPVAEKRGPGPVITFEFDGQPQLGGYSVSTAAGAAGVINLQKSIDGLVWQDVSGSSLTLDAGTTHYRRTLGVGSTLSASSHSGGGRGYRYYRLVATTELATTERAGTTICDVHFWLTGARHYRNADRIVHLYNYLLTGATKAVRSPDETRLVDTHATAYPELIGPFQVRIPLRLSVPDGHALVGADGLSLDDLVEPGTDFYLRPAPGASAATVTATTPHDLTGRVLTGEALAEAGHRFTPIALTVPTDVAIEFDIAWQTDDACTNIA
ncbi:thioester domain-containing protein [Mycobacterium palustre]|uniref:TQXA domain-containing protein n=1 Tax=Mycobacterium palustre TaxID=153971 RepID=A0A1X1Z9J0_9MYCO|nr:thioester domain-containing protein [Mycobacterium palustre]MCV7102345.1 TQXA domain-containing protein [Mycobacterium palustre]ORW20014.1 TQXA domain-containing protein [Mycobacterium palustre]